MKRFYTTSSPEGAPHILLDTVEQAIEQGRRQVAKGTHTRRFIVQIVAVVEEAPAPTQLVWLRENPDYDL